jgi:hypothetical protein
VSSVDRILHIFSVAPLEFNAKTDFLMFLLWLAEDDAVSETGELPRSKRKWTFAITPSKGTSISGGKLQACLCEANMHRA